MAALACDMHYPLFFNYHDRVFGHGFLAEVISHGRVLGVEEDGEIWIYGVEPGGLAATGDDPGDAFRLFRKEFRNALLDLAEEADSFEALQRAVAEMFHEINEPRAVEWRTAVDGVRRGSIVLDIPKEDADSACFVRVELKQLAQVSPDDNYPTTERALAA